MPIIIECLSCNSKLKVEDEFAGRKVKCPKCKSIIEVAPSQPSSTEDRIQAAPPARTAADLRVKTGKAPALPPAEDDWDDHEDDERRRPRRRRRDIDDDDEGADDEDRPRRRTKKWSRADLRAIATYQKVVLVCILVYIIAVVAQFLIPPALRLVVALGVLAVAVTAAVFVFLLATKVYNTALGIVMGILTLIPLVGLITLLIINSRATATLNINGIRVGLLGAIMSDLD